MLTLDKKKIIILKAVLLLVFLVYLFFLGKSFIVNATMVNIAETAQDLLKGDFLLSKWDLSYSSNLFSQIFYYLIPVHLFGVSSKAIAISIFLIAIATIVTGSLLLKDNPKDITFQDVLLLICFFGLGNYALQALQLNGASLPFVFLTLFFANKYLQTEKYQYLIITSLLNIFLVFGDIFSLVICIFPMMLYCFLSIFHKEHPVKYIRLLLTILLSTVFGVFLYTQYLHFNKSGAMYQWFASKSFIDDYINESNMSNVVIFIKSFTFIQNMNFFDDYIFSPHVIMYIFRTIISLIGLVLMAKIIFNVTTNKEEDNNDIILFSISSALIFTIFFGIFVEANFLEYVNQIFAIIPIGIAILIMRANKCFINLDKFQYYSIFLLSAFILITFCNKKLDEQIKESKYPLIAEILEARKLEFGYSNYEDAAVLNLLSKGKLKIAPILKEVPFNAILKKDYFSQEAQFYLVNIDETENYRKLIDESKTNTITVDDTIITVYKN